MAKRTKWEKRLGEAAAALRVASEGVKLYQAIAAPKPPEIPAIVTPPPTTPPSEDVYPVT